jgi:signal transduction histidine kinase
VTDQPCPPVAWTRRRATDAIVSLAMAVLSGLTIWGRFSGGESSALHAVDIGIAVVATALTPLLLRRPVAGTLAVTLLAALSPAATPQATLGALYVARFRSFRTALGVAVLGVAAQAIQGLLRPHGGLSFGWWLLLVAAAYAALIAWGALWQANHALVQSLREQARRAETEQAHRLAEARALERNRIAREMHDVLAHRLSLLATYAGALEYRPDAPPEQLSRAAAVVRDGAHQALDELREVITVLREDTDDVARPQPVLTDLPLLLDESRDAGVHIELVDRLSTSDPVPNLVGRTAYRVVQEAVTNARRHAPGQAVRVELHGKPGARLAIDIRNRLTRDAPMPVATATGTGLIGLAERVQLAGGELDHAASPDEFHVHAWLPWPR